MSSPADAIGPAWREWIAENRLRGCDERVLVQRMVDAGLALAASEHAVREMERDPVYRAALGTLARLAKLESMFESHQALWEAAPGYEVVERRSHLGREEFFERYYLACRPVIVSDLCRDWPALHRWRPESLARRFGDQEVEIQAGRRRDPHYELNSVKLRSRVRFGDFMRRVIEGGPSNDEYLTANNHAFDNPGFASLHDDLGILPPYLDGARLDGGVHWWVGPAGTATPLHHDTVMLFHAQVVGRKRWRLVSPLQTPRLYNERAVFSPVNLDAIDLERHPLMAGVKVLDVIVEPGEALFLPLAWWHQVDALEVSVSVSIASLAFPNSFSYADPHRP